MQPWNRSFAAEYQPKGNYPTNPPPYTPPLPHTATPSSHPNYNRSAAPFLPSSSSVSTQQQQNGYVSEQPSFNNKPRPFYSQEQQQFHQQQQQQQQPSPMSVQHNQQAYNQDYPQQQQAQTLDDGYYQDPYEAAKQPNREEPDMDEDFPSYRELRSVFLQKEKEDDAPQRPKTLPRKIGKLGDGYEPPIPYEPQREQRKPPPPTPLKPQQQQQRSIQQVQSPQASQNQRPQRIAPQQPSSTTQQKSSFTQIQTSSRAINRQNSGGTPGGHGHQTRYSQPDYPMTPQKPPTYTEIPVQHISANGPASSDPWNQQPRSRQMHSTRNIVTRQEMMEYKPPMSININAANDVYSYDSPSPKVTITSNSPRSPQKAFYRPDDYNDLIVGRRRRHSVTISPNVTVLNGGFDNQPRRRTSYAEITISGAHNSLPRNFTTRPGLIQRSVSQISSRRLADPDDDEFYPSFGDLKQQFINNEVQDLYPRSFGISYGNKARAEPSGSGFTRVSMRRSSMQGNPTHSTSDTGAQNPFGAFSATIRPNNPAYQPSVRVGPNVQYTSDPYQPGKTASHRQFNSPMGLYSTANAQEALDKDPEAAKLLKINGKDKNKKAIINSPTLQAVLREDVVKRSSGHRPDVNFFYSHREYGPGIGPLRQYEEVPDTLCQSITAYNQAQDKSLTYKTWEGL